MNHDDNTKYVIKVGDYYVGWDHRLVSRQTEAYVLYGKKFAMRSLSDTRQELESARHVKLRGRAA